jgi:nucleotide-binding universal stress UspA family protein
MESSAPARVLVVAHRTAATPALLDAVRARAAAGPAIFTLLVPRAPHGLHRFVDPEDTDDAEAQEVLELALPLLEEAVGAPVEGKIGDPNPADAIQDAVNIDGYDEIIISTLPARVSKWLHINLPAKLTPLGLPITTVTAKSSRAARAGRA